MGEGELDADLRAFVSSVWEDYRGFSAITLREKAREEPPWRDARERGQRREITLESLRAYFSTIGPRPVRRLRRRPPAGSWFDQLSPFAAGC